MPQTVQALLEAEAYPGPSIVIAYSHCIAHGYDMAHGVDQQKLAVDSGVWPLYRFDPRRVEKGEPPMHLDYGQPKARVADYMRNEARFRVRDITASDLQQIETRVELGRAQLTNALGQYGTAQGAFLREVGARPGTLAAPDLIDVKVASLDQALSVAEINAPLVRAAQAREKISRAAYEGAKAESRPRIDLQGSADYGTVSPYSDRLRTTQLVGRAVLTQPPHGKVVQLLLNLMLGRMR